ncbi:uncharacterized protein C8R40DRAFT_1075006 [Lentinula edodes]|uniref:uncharacterized protein n=1 Tax=Lentinula edodes TaxID=5353 RepID=UPI001E8DBB23|nr:uncharacterized protein C8R40DRAFT_1075006 [Lentinula edodes]KAH7868240.1 hypothetical protein C8R40DRAFT_1075006 [Lentinula edodes]
MLNDISANRREHFLSLDNYMGKPNNTIMSSGAFFRDDKTFLFSNVRVPGGGKPKAKVVTFVSRVLNNNNFTGMTGNWVPSKKAAKHGKRTAMLGPAFNGKFELDWDQSIQTLKDIMCLLTKDRNHDVKFLWYEEDPTMNDGTFRFGSPLFRALRAGEDPDSTIVTITPEGQQNTPFWVEARQAHAIVDFPVFDSLGSKVAANCVQGAIKGAMVAVDVVIQGWKFKSDPNWGFALDLKRLTILEDAHEAAEDVDLPPLQIHLPDVAVDNATVLPLKNAMGNEDAPGSFAPLTPPPSQSTVNAGVMSTAASGSHDVQVPIAVLNTGQTPHTEAYRGRSSDMIRKRCQTIAYPGARKRVQWQNLVVVCPTLAFKGAAMEHGAALIGGVPMESIPHATTMDCGQEYFFVDVGSALEMGVLTGWSEQLNKRNVVIFADIHQLAPLKNHNQAFWLHDNPITHKFLSNVHWLDTEPIHDRTSNTFLDTIRLATIGRDHIQLLNASVANMASFVKRHARRNAVVVSNSRERCKQLNQFLLIEVAKALNATLYMFNSFNDITFSIGATVTKAELKLLQDNICDCGAIPGRMPVYIGMPCSVIIDSTPVWGTIFDIELDPRESAEIPRQYEWFMDADEDVIGYVVRTQVPLAPRWAVLEKEVDGQQYDALLIDTEKGWDSIQSWYMVGSRVQGHGLINISQQVDGKYTDSWLQSVRECMLQLLCLKTTV